MRAKLLAALSTVIAGLAGCATPWVQPGTTYAVTVANTGGEPCILSYDTEGVGEARGLGEVPGGAERTFSITPPRSPLVTLTAACGGQPAEGAPSREVRLRGDRTVRLEVPAMLERAAPRSGGGSTPR
jgi:hypothetical protein